MAPLRLLLVGDEAFVLEMEPRLRRLGHRVVDTAGTASTALKALSLPELGPVDLVVADPASAPAMEREGGLAVACVGMPPPPGAQAPSPTGRPPGLVPPFSGRELALTLETAMARQGTARAVHELEGFFAVSLDMLCFLGFDGSFRRLNPAWERTLGFTVEELKSRPFIEFVHPDDRERTRLQNAAVRAGGQARGFENRYLCKDGSYRWFLWNAVADRDEGVIYSVAHDITHRKVAEAERQRLVTELQESLAEVRTLRRILPICMYCRKIRDDEDYWHTVESYLSRNTDTRFSHGICPSCMATEVEPAFRDLDGGPDTA